MKIYISHIFTYILILNYYHLKIETVGFRPCEISKYSQSYDLPFPPPAQMLHVLCRPVWSTCRCRGGSASGFFLSFAIEATLCSPGCFENDPPA